MKRLTIYCDMDGVLADFNAENNAVERFKKEKGFFKKLQPIIENLEGLILLYELGYNIKILTTSPHNRADRDKKIWLNKYLNFISKENIIFARPDKPKIDYVENKDFAILIDDYSKNINEWMEGGGLHAIKITQKPKVSEIDYLDIKSFVNYIKRL